MLNEDDTSSALAAMSCSDAAQAQTASAQLGDTQAAPSAAEPTCEPPARLSRAYDTFDAPSVSAADPAPRLPPDATFAVVLGCEVMYELAHAEWVSAVLQARLQRGGKAIIAGAIRDRTVRHLAPRAACAAAEWSHARAQVFRAFEQLLQRGGLRFCQQIVTPVAGYSGLGKDEDFYDGGFVMYFCEHAVCPCADWHVDLSHLTWGQPLYPHV